jgi:tRNA (guanine-N7-)-methyltransferase
MGRKKLFRFAENENAFNVIQPEKPLYETIKGNWNSDFFKNEKPIVLELGCGRGEYSIGLAKNFPEKNFIGIDIKGSRIWKGSQVAIEENLDNVGFLRTYIQNIHQHFATQEVSEIWITFPDPRPRDSDERRRMTHPRFLKMYQSLIKLDGIVHLKTDNRPLFDYTLEVLAEMGVRDLEYTFDLYNSSLNQEHFGIKTTYEAKFTELGYHINYLRFRFKSNSNSEKSS